jgi:hypothetical protein
MKLSRVGSNGFEEAGDEVEACGDNYLEQGGQAGMGIEGIPEEWVKHNLYSPAQFNRTYKKENIISNFNSDHTR